MPVVISIEIYVLKMVGPGKNLADVQFCILVSKSSGKLVTLVFQQTVRPILDHIQNVGGEPGFIANPHWLMGEQE